MTDASMSPDPALASEPSFPSGTLLSDRYRIDSLIGSGGMGSVYRAEHVHMRKMVAIKVLHASFSTLPDIVARFEREAVAAANIDHPNVASATDFGRLPDGSFFLVLEYLEGRTLRSALEQQGALEPKRALRIALGICRGIGAAHERGIVHRDLKPENVILVRLGDDLDFPRVLDFGVAKLADLPEIQAPAHQPLTRLGMVIGTPDYMSPEQALGQPIDARSDLYSLGVVLFEMLTGRCPFDGDATSVIRKHVLEPAPSLPMELLARLPPSVSEVLARLLEKNPQSRFQTAQQVQNAFEELLEHLEGGHRATEPPNRSTPRVHVRHPLVERIRKAGRRELLAVLAGLALIALTARACNRSASKQEPVAVVPRPDDGPVGSELDASAATVSSATAVAAAQDQAPAPSARANPGAAKSSTPRGGPTKGTRKRTSGGIRIPPPDQWFK